VGLERKKLDDGALDRLILKCNLTIIFVDLNYTDYKNLWFETAKSLSGPHILI
jgi:hypothetical protein